MCFTSVIEKCFELHPIHLFFIHPIETFKEGFIASYQYIYARQCVKQCWFLFNLYGYSTLLLPILDKYHPKHGNAKSLEQSNSGIESEIWVLKYMRKYIKFPRNHKDFSSIVTKLIVGRMKIVILPGFVITCIQLLLIGSFPRALFCFWKDWYQHALFVFIYFLGYAFMSVPKASMEELLKKTGLYYLISGILLLLLEQARVSLGLKITTSQYFDRIFARTLKGFGRWMFILGSYGVIGIARTKRVTGIGLLRQMAMPFYLLHHAVEMMIQSVTIGLILRLGKFKHVVYFNDQMDFKLLEWVSKVCFGTLITGTISYVVAKSPDRVKYCFGLSSSKSNNSSKHWVQDYGIFISLVFIKIIGYAIVKWNVVKSEI